MLNTAYQQYIHKSRYARWIPEKQRRENWEETVGRYCDFFSKRFGDIFPREEIYLAILNLEIMPSMRALMTAGKALDKDEIAGYNCSYIPIDNVRAFDEILYILMCGTGVGFSVERQSIAKLPIIPEELYTTDTKIAVYDSRVGWAKAYKELLSLLYAGNIPMWDLSALRPAGSPLKTFGGRSSGPDPLNDLFLFTIDTFKLARGRKLNSLECHDLVCKIADIVVVGGVRRSALISLSNLTDDRMRNAKMGQWWESEGQRALANNSVCYTEKPDIAAFMKEWVSLYESKSGERGLYNRVSAIKQAEKYGRRDINFDFGTNPCGEIILRPNGLCNLTEVVVRPIDTIKDLERKVRLATVLGTFQSTLTNFRYLRSIWKKNAEEERLLGVSFTGIMDHLVLREPSSLLEEWLKSLRQLSEDTNKEWAQLLGINKAAAITTVKPSGTVSQLVDTASGIHPRFAPYYIRTVRNDIKDPLTLFLVNSGVPAEPDVTKPYNTLVFSFAMKSPDNSLFKDQLSALQQLEHYMFYKQHWCEHNPSITVYVKEEEWLEVGSWVYKNFNDIGGISFLPHIDHIYKQAPYQEISKEVFQSFGDLELDWEGLKTYEREDSSTSTKELACLSGVCEL